MVVYTTTGNSRTVLYNTLNRPASQTITHRGMAMIPLRCWGHTWDWRMPRKKTVYINIYIFMYKTPYVEPRSLSMIRMEALVKNTVYMSMGCKI